MNINYLKFLIPVLTLGIVIFVYFSPISFKTIPLISVVFMTAGFNYALFKYLKSSPMDKNKINYPKSYNQFEREVKLAKPIRIVGMLLFFVLIISWIDLIQINLHPYFSLLVMAVLLIYFFMAVNYYRKIIIDKKNNNSPN